MEIFCDVFFFFFCVIFMFDHFLKFETSIRIMRIKLSENILMHFFPEREKVSVS